ncbi:DUF1648 domain-containing protein [Demequina sp. SYSU T00192]|uniref:DUF1648 domain-containing protein n=1 Tax=Demequina litoralis TaxID=3051660 RepID=A0ABT8GC44_9MICO|nr:DUF1648 domain-containing protein [Demequina sp. SYSU T00192]MDN4476713.1 DUF1648 domain-containing protein [Demequina sp. SYSU T00192]
MTTNDGALGRATAVGVVTPAVLCAVAVGLELAVIGDVPDPVATHWSGSSPDGFASPALVPVMTVVVGGVLPIVLGASGLRSIRRGERGFVLRFMPAVAAGLATLMAVLMVGSLLIQRGLDDAAQAPSVLPTMWWGLGSALVVGALGWLVQPRHEERRREAVAARPLSREPGERTVWVGRAELSPPALAAIVAGVLVAVVAAVANWLVGDEAVAWIVTGLAVLLAFLAASFTVFHVRIDPTGLTVRSAARIVRMRVPAADVEVAAPTEVSGLAQYGGYGIRSVPGATGVIMRSGPALEVTRRGGRRFVVTVDDPTTAAAVLAAVAEDAHAAQD